MTDKLTQAALPRAPRPIPPTTDELRAKAIAWAVWVVSNPDTVFLDTETTGKEPTSEVCDIGIVALDGTVLINQLIKPSIPIPDEASAIHGITNEMVACAPSWASFHDQVAAALDGRLTVIYNRQYDHAIITNEGKRIGRPIAMHTECAMLAFSDFKGEPGRYGSMKWHRLDAAAAHFDIPPGGHRALADAETARRVVMAMAAQGQEEHPHVGTD